MRLVPEIKADINLAISRHRRSAAMDFALDATRGSDTSCLLEEDDFPQMRGRDCFSSDEEESESSLTYKNQHCPNLVYNLYRRKKQNIISTALHLQRVGMS